mmetsp:Transcript_36179/g.115863  ORF Transcript_36179/g.115863 Transcript_36179/m.115863 type:complete len:528 (-) Transcript_36179:61-1644(-)
MRLGWRQRVVVMTLLVIPSLGRRVRPLFVGSGSGRKRWVASGAKLPSAAELAVDLRTMKEHGEVAKSHLRARGSEMAEEVDRLGAMFDVMNEQKREKDEALRRRKSASAEVGKLMKAASEADEAAIAALKATATEAAEEAAACDREVERLEAEAAALLARTPNFLDVETPTGASEAENVVVKVWRPGDRLMGESFLWHDELAASLYDADAAARVSGARFAVLRGALARLERAVTNFFLDRAAEKGYAETSVPLVVSRTSLEGTGQLPKFEDDLFKLANHKVRGEDAFLIPTAEVPLTNLLAGELVDEGDLPLKLAAATPCFRAEAGSYGRDTRGLVRQHQFPKVELVKVVTRDTAHDEHLQTVRDAEELLEDLELPYRTVALCSGDLGFSARKCFDLEVWLPGQQAYREISSVSLCHDFQARRMGLRYRPRTRTQHNNQDDNQDDHDDDDAGPGSSAKNKKTKATKPKKEKPQFPFTINGSGLAVGRTLVALLENGQQPDGSIRLPKAIVPYMGGIDTIKPHGEKDH